VRQAVPPVLYFYLALCWQQRSGDHQGGGGVAGGVPEVQTPRSDNPADHLHDIQTAPARLQESFDEELYDRDFLEKVMLKIQFSICFQLAF
jgi:hypothetical protein